MKAHSKNRRNFKALFQRSCDEASSSVQSLDKTPGREGQSGTEAKRVLGGQLAFLKRTSRLSSYAFPRIK
jgi:hypothetical protein